MPSSLASRSAARTVPDRSDPTGPAGVARPRAIRLLAVGAALALLPGSGGADAPASPWDPARQGPGDQGGFGIAIDLRVALDEGAWVSLPAGRLLLEVPLLPHRAPLLLSDGVPLPRKHLSKAALLVVTGVFGQFGE